MAVAVVKGVGKLAIAAGAVYLTVDQGIWSGSLEGASTLKKLSGTYSIPSQEEYLQQMPSTKGIAHQMRQGWNSGVKWSFECLAAAPEKVGDITSSASSWVSDSVTGKTE